MVRIPLIPFAGELRSLKLCSVAKKKKKKDVGNLAEALRYRSVKFKSGIVQGPVRGSKTQKKIYGSRKSIL